MNLDSSWRLTITIIFVNLAISGLTFGLFYLWFITSSDKRFATFDRRMNGFEAEIRADIQGLHGRIDARLRRLEERHQDNAVLTPAKPA
jgi:hypothetical protein